MNKLDQNTVVPGALPLNDREFKLFRDLIFLKSGINLHDGKKELLRTRLGSRIRSKGLPSFASYYDLVRRDKTGVELMGVLDAISTNITSFFREINHFNFLNEVAIPQIVDRKAKSGDNSIRFWSAGCSSGEEPYSLAFTLLEHKKISRSFEIKVLATDISLEMLERASTGVYSEEKLVSVSKDIKRDYFQKGSGDNAGMYRVKPEVRQIIYFKRFNLMMNIFPFKHKFDCIFCRNVMIYFDKPTQETLVNKYYQSLGPGGYLLIGHSESLTGVNHNFKYVRPTIYQKPL